MNMKKLTLALSILLVALLGAAMIYGLGGIVIPFIGIKAIDLLVTALHLA